MPFRELPDGLRPLRLPTSGFLDTNGPFHARRDGQRFLPTVSISCDFLASVPRGAWVEGRLEVLRVTRHPLFASGLLQVASQGPVARTSGVMKIGGEIDARFAPERYFDAHPIDRITD